MKRIFVFACAILLFAFVSDDVFKQLHKLSGIWVMKTEKGTINEMWDIEDNNRMTGASFFVTKDTMIMERMELKREGNDIFYIPTVEGQNNNKPVSFKLLKFTNNTFTFENKSHDFPQRIIYRFVNNDSIVARIEGEVKGKKKFQDYFYSRSK